MKIIIVGGTGTIGRKVSVALEKEHEVIKVGSKSGDFQAGITSSASIESLFKSTGPFDALISTTGLGHFGPLNEMTIQSFQKGINSKLLGQINLVLIGQHYINEGGSFTLTSGILAKDPIRNGVNLSTVNAGINGFVLGASVELKRNLRINAVSPGVVEDSPDLFPAFPGHQPVTMDKVVYAYIKSVLGLINGQVIEVF